MNVDKKSLRIELHVTSITARALGKLAEIASIGDEAKAQKFTEEDMASQVLEASVYEHFKQLLGMPPAIFFGKQQTCVQRRDGLKPRKVGA